MFLAVGLPLTQHQAMQTPRRHKLIIPRQAFVYPGPHHFPISEIVSSGSGYAYPDTSET